jgi:hypothetical protein
VHNNPYEALSVEEEKKEEEIPNVSQSGVQLKRIEAEAPMKKTTPYDMNMNNIYIKEVLVQPEHVAKTNVVVRRHGGQSFAQAIRGQAQVRPKSGPSQALFRPKSGPCQAQPESAANEEIHEHQPTKQLQGVELCCRKKDICVIFSETWTLNCCHVVFPGCGSWSHHHGFIDALGSNVL